MCVSPERNQRFSTTMFFHEISLVVRSGKPLAQIDLVVDVEGREGVDARAVLLPGPLLEHFPNRLEINFQDCLRDFRRQ